MNKVLRSKIFTVGMLFLIVWIVIYLVKIDERKTLVVDKIKGLEDKIEAIKNSNKYLENFLANLSNPSFLEKEVRIKLNYKAVDENVAFVHSDESVKVASPSQNFQKEISKINDYLKWWRHLLGY